MDVADSDVADSLEKAASWQGGTSMQVEENMALTRRFLEAHVKGDLDTVDEMLASDFVGHTKLFPGQEPGREGVKWATARLSAAISNVSIFVEDQSRIR
jgi:hypothetical protein